MSFLDNIPSSGKPRWRITKKILKKRKPPRFLKYLFIALVIIFGLNFALVFPTHFSTLFFLFEVAVVRFLASKVFFLRWELFIILIITALGGYFTMPTLHAPSLPKTFFWRRRWKEGKLRFFKSWSGYVIVVNDTLLQKSGFRYTVRKPVERRTKGGNIILETGKVEVSRSLVNRRLIETLEEKIEQLSDTVEKSGTVIDKNEVQDIISKEAKQVLGEVQNE